MSGIVGIAGPEGRPVPHELLQGMTRFLAFRGPDAQQTSIQGSVGLGHAAHQIPGDSTRGSDIETLGNGCWVTASIRLDARHELVANLRAHGEPIGPSSTDSRLLLHAYHIWAEDCLRHLAGDFSFILWDQPRRQLFCACDHFGIRQLYFAEVRGRFLCSNSLECLRLHPDVSARLNDYAIADFLLFGMNQCEATTCFSDIQRLPRGHYLRWSPTGLHIAEYWRPPLDGRLRYKNPHEYVEHFTELLGKAVADRTRGDKTGILLSGGLDSSSVAAFSNAQQQNGNCFQLHAFTASIDDVTDPDSRAAQIVADALDIPLHFTVAREIPTLDQLNSTRFPEPVDDLFGAELIQQFEQIGQHSPAVLSGEGADNLMDFEPWPHLRSLWREKQYVRAALDIGQHAFARLRMPGGIRGLLNRISARAGVGGANDFPDWLNLDFVNRLDLMTRWLNPTPNISWNAHPQHPRTYGSLFFPQWSYMFQREDPAFTRSPVEVRYPFLDLRIVNYLLAIPVMPWFFRKFLLRESVRGRLPESIRNRPKVTSGEDPLVSVIKRSPSILAKGLLDAAICEYVNKAALSDSTWTGDPEAIAARVRPWCLSIWLAQNNHSREDLAQLVHA